MLAMVTTTTWRAISVQNVERRRQQNRTAGKPKIATNETSCITPDGLPPSKNDANPTRPSTGAVIVAPIHSRTGSYPASKCIGETAVIAPNMTNQTARMMLNRIHGRGTEGVVVMVSYLEAHSKSGQLLNNPQVTRGSFASLSGKMQKITGWTRGSCGKVLDGGAKIESD